LAAKGRSTFRIVAVAGDVAIAVGALYVAFYLRTHVVIPGTESLLPLAKVRFTPANVFLVAAVQAAALSVFGLYRDHERFREPLLRLLLPVLFVELLTLASAYFLAQPYSFPRSVLVLYLVLDGVALLLWRAGLDRLLPAPRRRALIVGTGPAAALIAETIRRHPWTGVEAIGLVGDGTGPRHGLPLLGPLERLAEIAEREKVDEVILTPQSPSWRDRISEWAPDSLRADLLVWPSPFETMIGRLRFRIVGDLPLLEARVRPLEGLPSLLKRGFDLVVASALLVVSIPILLAAALAVAASSAGGVFYRQTRVGQDGRPFRLWKLRTMRARAEEQTGAVLSTPGDPRVTAVGRALRATRIDEIPQLWNVLVGDMSLVGPRPERPEFAGRFVESVPGYALRHSVRPGLTGLAQISGEYKSEPEIKLRYDLAYINNWSMGLDLAILLRTMPVILTRRGV
jgi:exopolysaccharide biosynthesis polyprenyl glycosylphosphotransferase